MGIDGRARAPVAALAAGVPELFISVGGGRKGDIHTSRRSVEGGEEGDCSSMVWRDWCLGGAAGGTVEVHTPDSDGCMVVDFVHSWWTVDHKRRSGAVVEDLVPEALLDAEAPVADVDHGLEAS